MALLLFECLRETDAGEVLHDDVEVVVGLDHIVYFDDVGVVDQLQDPYLPPDCPLPHIFPNLPLLVSLDGNFTVFRSENGYSDTSIGTFPDHLADHVVLFELGSEVS